MGISTAVHLGRQGLGDKVLIVERDTSYKYCSALLSAGGVRQQYSLPENIHMSKYGSNFLQEYAKKNEETGNDGADISFKPHGYMFLAANQDQKKILETNNATQRSCGVDWIHLAESEELSGVYPWLNTEDIVVGSHSNKEMGTREGYFDPWGMMQCMKKEATDLNCLFVEGRVDQVKCVQEATTGEPKLTADTLHLRHGKGDNNDIEEIKGLDVVINTTGAWMREFVKETICEQNSSHLSSTQKEDILKLLPIERRKRCIFYIHCPNRVGFSHPMPNASTPLTIDPTGVYFRSEGSTPGYFICGVSPEAHLDHEFESDEALEIVDHHLFEEVVWPTLAHRVPAFNEIKVQSAWSGFYDYNAFDQNAIIGCHPHFTNFICAGGFSGHGLQMAPATGLLVSELVLHKEFQSIDVNAFGFDRLLRNEPYWETGIV